MKNIWINDKYSVFDILFYQISFIATISYFIFDRSSNDAKFKMVFMNFN